MKLQPLNLNKFKSFELKNRQIIIGGISVETDVDAGTGSLTCVDTCCGGSHGHCDDHEEDED